MSGAGIIIYRYFDDNIKFLALEVDAKMALKNGGKYDLPKGTGEPGESVEECAIRETFEETNILVSAAELSNEYLVSGPLTMFYSETIQNPKILPQKDTGIFEHVDYKWVSDIELYANCYQYLKPFVKWATASIQEK